jgi:hypothetical protein
MHALQLMAFQAVGETLHILPAWPPEWPVDFKLAAPGGTVVTVHYRPGQSPRVQRTGTDTPLPMTVHQPD